MIKKIISMLLVVFSGLILAGCSASSTSLPPTVTSTSIPATPTTLPSATALPPTETATQAPPTATATATAVPGPVIEHFPVGQEFTVTSIHMIDENIGWAIGGLDSVGEHVLKTQAGGSAWKDITPPEPAAPEGERKVAAGYFLDASNAWVIYTNTSGITPAQPFVWRTQDGGLSWQASQPLDVSNLSEFYGMPSLQFVDGQSGWLLVHVGAGMNHDYIALYQSQDGGMSWLRIQDPYNDTSSIMSCSKTGMLFTDATHGWLTGDCNGVAAGVLLYKSTDGGLTWESVTLPDPSGAPGLFTTFQSACGSYDPFFFSNDLGHLAVNCTNYDQNPITYQYYVFTTQDGGTTWTSSTYPGESLYFYSASTGWALARKIQRSSDGGLTWTAMSNVTWSAEVDFITENVGWAVATDENQQVALVKTIDGGKKWAMLVPTVVP